MIENGEQILQKAIDNNKDILSKVILDSVEQVLSLYMCFAFQRFYFRSSREFESYRHYVWNVKFLYNGMRKETHKRARS